MELASTPTPPTSLSSLQAAILGAVERYSYTQARPVTIRDIYRRLRLEKNLVLMVVRELKDMGLMDVQMIRAGNKWRVMTVKVTDYGREWILN